MKSMEKKELHFFIYMYITVIGLTIDLFLLACLVAVPLPPSAIS